jgi:mono/diheme cytochrome c family protein
MKRAVEIGIPVLGMLLGLAGCHKEPAAPVLHPKANGAALVESSGGKQAGFVGSPLDQPLVVQVNDAQGNGVAGALVSFTAAGDATVTPATGLTAADGTLTVNCQLGSVSGRYRIVATTWDKNGKAITLNLDEIALGYQQNLGRQLNEKYCSRCHNQESTVERVSNYDNLATKPHSFTDGGFYNTVNGADIAAIITYGGAARHQSAEMPSYGGTLSKSDVEALVSYVRAVSDPPYREKGLIYARQ